MTSYTKNIPQPTDDPSASQDQILQNFQTLNTVYGDEGDHYPWTNANVVENNKHAKVTMPGLPTTNAPGNALPTPAAGNCAIFSQTINSQTTPFVARDGLAPTAPYTNIWPLLPIKAYVSITTTGVAGAQTINSSFNVTSAVLNAGLNTLTITMPNALRTSSYGIFPIMQNRGPPTFAITGTTIFTLFTSTLSIASNVINILVIEP